MSAFYKEILKSQNGRCAICGDHHKKHRNNFPLDHNHTTGKIRGILCNLCNTGLGMFKDSRTLLRRAERYLESHEWVGRGNPKFKMLKNRVFGVKFKTMERKTK